MNWKATEILDGAASLPEVRACFAATMPRGATADESTKALVKDGATRAFNQHYGAEPDVVYWTGPAETDDGTVVVVAMAYRA